MTESAQRGVIPIAHCTHLQVVLGVIFLAQAGRAATMDFKTAICV